MNLALGEKAPFSPFPESTSYRTIGSKQCSAVPLGDSHYERALIRAPVGHLKFQPFNDQRFSGSPSAFDSCGPLPAASQLSCSSSARHPPKHLYFQALATPLHFMAGVEVYCGI
jgi:hypothetical protein